MTGCKPETRAGALSRAVVFDWRQRASAVLCEHNVWHPQKCKYPEQPMSESTVLRLAEPTRTMTFAEGRAFIERTRRQLDRFDALPHAEGAHIATEDAAAIRRMCDELEADINRSLSTT
jgi:hypothetical protein